MKIIRKYTLERYGEQLILMPMDARILAAGASNRTWCIWAMIWTEKPEIHRRIVVHSTNDEIFGGEYIGTVSIHGSSATIHVFDLGEEGELLEPILTYNDLGPKAQKAYQSHIQEKREK